MKVNQKKSNDDETFRPKKKISKEEMRRIKRLNNAMKSKNLDDLYDLDEDLS